mmetsp:Transcript_53842/g.116386  ORF Transcript_53842/g.116386 Transcript_53842/m.116386 type:complete len:218 (+) Transcript_53842:749-1402(+)
MHLCAARTTEHQRPPGPKAWETRPRRLTVRWAGAQQDHPQPRCEACRRQTQSGMALQLMIDAGVAAPSFDRLARLMCSSLADHHGITQALAKARVNELLATATARSSASRGKAGGLQLMHQAYSVPPCFSAPVACAVLLWTKHLQVCTAVAAKFAALSHVLPHALDEAQAACNVAEKAAAHAVKHAVTPWTAIREVPRMAESESGGCWHLYASAPAC